MHDHLTAWKAEYGKAVWRGPYDIGPVVSVALPGARLLDAGCGSGKMAVPLARAGYRVVGMDLVRDGLREARGKADMELVAGDVRNLPFKDGTYDAAVCYDVLQHLLEPERTLAVNEIRRILAPGGHIFIEAFGREDMRYGGPEAEPHTFRRESGIVYHYFSEGEMESLLAGFRGVRVKSTLTRKVFRGREYSRHRVFACGTKGR